MFHLSNTLQSAFRTWFYPEGAAGAANIDAARVEVRPRIEAAWERIASAPVVRRAPDVRGTTQRGGLLRNHVDALVAQHAAARNQLGEIASYVARMKARPSFRELYAREGLTEWS
jgi:glutathione S-transferase